MGIARSGAASRGWAARQLGGLRGAPRGPFRNPASSLAGSRYGRGSNTALHLTGFNRLSSRAISGRSPHHPMRRDTTQVIPQTGGSTSRGMCDSEGGRA
jgi:hypothetical protein